MANLYLIKTLAEKQKLPLTELAAKVGISEQQVHLMCRKNSTKIETLEKIAMALNVPVSCFFDDKPVLNTDYAQTVTDNHGLVAQHVDHLDNRKIVQEEDIRIEETTETVDCRDETKHIIDKLNREIMHLRSQLKDKDERISEYKERINEYKERVEELKTKQRK